MRSDLGVIRSEPIKSGFKYRMWFDAERGWPTRQEIRDKLEVQLDQLDEKLFASCGIDEDMRVGTCTVEVKVASAKVLPSKLPFRNVRGGMREAHEDTCQALLVSAGDEVEFAIGAARYKGRITEVGNVFEPHTVVIVDSSNHVTAANRKKEVPALAILSLENYTSLQSSLKITPEIIVREQLYGE